MACTFDDYANKLCGYNRRSSTDGLNWDTAYKQEIEGKFMCYGSPHNQNNNNKNNCGNKMDQIELIFVNLNYNTQVV